MDELPWEEKCPAMEATIFHASFPARIGSVFPNPFPLEKYPSLLEQPLEGMKTKLRVKQIRKCSSSVGHACEERRWSWFLNDQKMSFESNKYSPNCVKKIHFVVLPLCK